MGVMKRNVRLNNDERELISNRVLRYESGTYKREDEGIGIEREKKIGMLYKDGKNPTLSFICLKM